MRTAKVFTIIIAVLLLAIAIGCNNKPTDIPDPEPICSITPTTLDFSDVEVGSYKGYIFRLRNVGEGTLEGLLPDSCGPFSIRGNKAYKLTQGMEKLVTVNFTPTSLGEHTCELNMVNGCSMVTFTGEGVEPYCHLEVASPTSDTVWTENESRTITWTKFGDCGDVLIELFNQNVKQYDIAASTPNTGSYTWLIPFAIADTVDYTGTSPKYHIKITDIASGNNDHSEFFRINCPSQYPALCVSPDSLDHTPNVIRKKFGIFNCGGVEPLLWEVSGNQDWMSLSPSSGSTYTETDSVTVTVDRTGLGDGTYNGEVIVTSNYDGLDTIAVSMVVGPYLCVSSSILNFQTFFINRSFSITNCGNGGTITWSASVTQPWMSIDSTSGETTTESDPISVTVDRTGLASGTYNGEVIVTSNYGGPDTVSVIMQVAKK